MFNMEIDRFVFSAPLCPSFSSVASVFTPHHSPICGHGFRSRDDKRLSAVNLFNAEGTEENGGRRVLSFGVDHAAQAIAQMFNMEIDQQADLATRKTDIGE
jgi:hypothetical protein